MIDKAFRKITISNPGTFRISVDEAIAGGISDARNGTSGQNWLNLWSRTVLHAHWRQQLTVIMAEMKVSVSTINRVYKSLKRKSYITRDNQTRGEWIILK